MTSSKIIDLATHRQTATPHLSGMAKCLACGHEWQAVVEIEGFEGHLECSECGTCNGILKYPVKRDGYMWRCGCGNTLFTLTPYGPYCPWCGAWCKGWMED
jgi:hypothetical protein